MPPVLDRDHTCTAGHLERHAQRVLVGLGAGVHEEDAVEVTAGETGELGGCTRTHIHRHGVALEVAGGRLRAHRLGPTRVTVAERCHGVAAVQVEHPTPVARVQEHAFRVHHFHGVLCKDWCEEICGAHVQPVAQWVSPVVSGRPSRRFIHCIAPPAAPLVRLSMAHITATVRPLAAAESVA